MLCVQRDAGASLLWLAGLLLSPGLPAIAQQPGPSYLRELPTPAAVQAAFTGSSTAQALGRQCAALTRMRGLSMFPHGDRVSAAGLAAEKAYQQALAAVEQRYKLEVNPLTETPARQEWSRMCGNRRSGIHPVSGQPDAGFPALDQPITEAEITALFTRSFSTMRSLVTLFTPAVKAVYERERATRAERGAVTNARNEQAREAAESRRWSDLLTQLGSMAGLAALGMAVPVVLLLYLGWLFVTARRAPWVPGADGRSMRLQGKDYTLVPQVGMVLEHERVAREVTATHVQREDDGRTIVHTRRHTEITQHLQMAWSDGRRKQISLHGFDLPCSEGDTLRLHWLQRKGRPVPGLMQVDNLTQGAWRIDRDMMKSMLVPCHPLLAFAILFFGGAATLGVGWVLGIVWLFWVNARANRAMVALQDWLHRLPPPA